MNIQFLNRTFTIEPASVIVGKLGCYAKIQLPGREGTTFTHYVPVTLVYTCAEPPKPLTVTLTPEMAASVNASAGVRIVVMPRPTLWHERLIA